MVMVSPRKCRARKPRTNSIMIRSTRKNSVRREAVERKKVSSRRIFGGGLMGGSWLTIPAYQESVFLAIFPFGIYLRLGWRKETAAIIARCEWIFAYVRRSQG